MPEKFLHVGTNSVLPFLSSIKFEIFESNKKNFKITIIIKYILAWKQLHFLMIAKLLNKAGNISFFQLLLFRGKFSFLWANCIPKSLSEIFHFRTYYLIGVTRRLSTVNRLHNERIIWLRPNFLQVNWNFYPCLNFTQEHIRFLDGSITNTVFDNRFNKFFSTKSSG